MQREDVDTGKDINFNANDHNSRNPQDNIGRRNAMKRIGILFGGAVLSRDVRAAIPGAESRQESKLTYERCQEALVKMGLPSLKVKRKEPGSEDRESLSVHIGEAYIGDYGFSPKNSGGEDMNEEAFVNAVQRMVLGHLERVMRRDNKTLDNLNARSEDDLRGILYLLGFPELSVKFKNKGSSGGNIVQYELVTNTEYIGDFSVDTKKGKPARELVDFVMRMVKARWRRKSI